MMNIVILAAIALCCISQVHATNGTVVDNSTTCDYFATRITLNSTHDLCECEDGYSGNGTTCALEASLTCSRSSSDGYAMRVFLNQTFIDYYGYSQNSLAFLNLSCGGAVLENGFYVLSTPNYDACGTVRSNSSTNIIYSNVVTSNGGGLSTGKILYVPVACLVEAFLSVSLMDDDNGTSPLLLSLESAGSKIEFPTSEGTGSTTAEMYLYQDPNYANPFNGIPVLETTDMLYAEVALESPINALSLISRECWATPESSGNSEERFEIIEQPGCLNTRASDAKITSNGVTSYSRFEFRVFMFMPSNVAYLHCEIEICYMSEGRTCQPTCGASGRRKRSTNAKRLRSSAIIRAKQHVNSPPVIHPVATTPVTRERSEVLGMNTIFMIVAILAIVLLIVVGGVIMMCLINRKQSHKTPKNVPGPDHHVSI